MNDKHDDGTGEPQPHEQKASLVHWDRVDWVTPRCDDASREPTCLEWVIGNTLANAIAVVNAPFCGNDTRLDVGQVIDVVAGQINTGMLDHTILLLRDILKHCIRRGDCSLFAAENAGEEDMDFVVG